MNRTPVIPDRHGVTLLLTAVIVQYTYNLKPTRFSVYCNRYGHVLYSTGVARLGRASESGRTEIKITKKERKSISDRPEGKTQVTARRLGLASRALE